MANNNDRQNRPTLNLILECAAFFGVACIAVALIFAICFKGNTTLFSVFKSIGEAIAYTICILLAGFWIKRQKHIAWTICYVIFVVVIVVMFAMGFVNF